MAALTGLLGVVAACALIGLSRATHHRIVNPAPKLHGPGETPRAHPAALSPAERAHLLAVLNSNRYANVSVAQVYARETGRGPLLVLTAQTSRDAWYRSASRSANSPRSGDKKGTTLGHEEALVRLPSHQGSCVGMTGFEPATP